MSITLRIAGFQLRDLLRGRWLIIYGLLFLLATEGLLRLGGGDARALLSLSSLVLFLVPLVSLIFGTTSLYDAREFNEMMLAQPVARHQVFAGLYAGLASGLSIAAVIGISGPFLAHGLGTARLSTLIALLVSGVMLTVVFVAIAFLIALKCREKARGLAVAIAVWSVATIVYDGLVLLIANAYAAFPLERPMIALMLLNPVDLARVLLLMQLDVAALMGYTGAVFQRFFGSGIGTTVVMTALATWVAAPVLLGLRAFNRRDF
jgi:Cu-processing system permease protein